MSTKSGDLAKRFDVSPPTIRSWGQIYESYLSQDATGRAPNAPRKYTPEDVILLATVADGRANGLSHDDIKLMLDRGRRVDTVPELPTEEEEEARKAIALVPVESVRETELETELTATKALAERLQGELARSIERWQDDTSKLQDEIKDLQRKLGTAEGELSQYKQREKQQNRLWIALVAVAVAAAVVLAVLVTITLNVP